MPIPLTCPSCGAKMNAGDKLAGRVANCPKCHEPIPVPAALPEWVAASGNGAVKTAPAQTAALPQDSGPDPVVRAESRPPSYPLMRARLVYVRLRQQVRAACDAVGFGPATGTRIALVLVLAAALFGAAMVAAFCLKTDPARAAAQAVAVGALAFAAGAFLLLARDDANLWTQGEYLAAALPDAKAAWEGWHRARREERQRLRDERRRQDQAWEEWKAHARETQERLQAAQGPAEVRPTQEEPPDEHDTRRCPFCAEVILARAVKCKHCGEFMDRGAAPTASGRGAVVHVHSGKSPGAAALLELLPGMFIQTFGIGHIYAGHVGTGLVAMFGYWLILAVNLPLVPMCGVGLVTGAFCWMLMMILSTLSAANCAQVGGGTRVVVRR